MERKEAIEVIKKNYPHVNESGSQFETALRILIPELKESEDERILKIIKETLKSYNRGIICGSLNAIDYADCLAWLEEQCNKDEEILILKDQIESLHAAIIALKEVHKIELEKQDKNNMGISEATKKKLEDNLNKALEKETPESWNEFLNEQGEQKPVDPDTLIQQRVDALADIVAEQKPADKVEPKFHEGEWITNGDYTWKVVEVKPLDYILQSQDGNIVDDTISHVDEQFHSFTPEDAKDGDVLVVNDNTQYKWIGIFKEHTGCTFTSYCHYNTGMDEFITNKARCRNHGTGKYSNIHPATKEQRDLLFSKMKEAGYEWDAEKKELNKIVTPIFNIGDTIIKKYNSNIHDFGFFTITDITGGKYWYNDRIICDITEHDEWEIYEQKPAEWSEEDDVVVKDICDKLNRLSMTYVGNESIVCQEEIKWLKSLRPKNTWKPSDEQMEVLDEVIRNPHLSTDEYNGLIALKEQLKAL